MKQFFEKLPPFVQALLIALLFFGGAYLLFGSGNPEQSAQENVEEKPVVQSYRSYGLEVISNISNIVPGQQTEIVYRIKNDQGKILKDFETVHEKIMHFLLVRRDLQEFQHLHPEFNQATGEFTVDVTFPSDGPYRVFPDFTPAESADNPQHLPVTLSSDIVVGDTSYYKAQPVAADASNIKIFGDYQISYATSQFFQAQSPASYSLTVRKNDQEVKDLQLYLGALGHSVILKAETLDFIHTHAESGRGTGPYMSFTTSFPEPGLYKTFTQFQHEGKVMTSEYVISVAPSTSTRSSDDQPIHKGGH